MKRKPIYVTPDGTVCPACGKPCTIVPLLNDFDYSGTHCTGGKSGTHYPEGWGSPVSSCCEVNMEDAEEYEPDYDGPGEEDGPWAEGWHKRCGRD